MGRHFSFIPGPRQFDRIAISLFVVKIDPTSHKEAYRDAVELARALNERKVAAHAGNIELTGTRPEDITMNVDGVPVKIGEGDLPRKLEKLDFVRDELGKRNMPVEYIDLRFADRIVVKPLKQDVRGPERKGKPEADKDGKSLNRKTPDKKRAIRKLQGVRQENMPAKRKKSGPFITGIDAGTSKSAWSLPR